ncbi:tyrosine-type recombinase/integrase [Deefgea rivuli]|uniref:tyrosine-type recombinase/integrase n=1 Tax=Deefgea rivuli TaxID=400948 RepID=UPI000687F18E|nr:tyrosine-type recombinase/integrase [Deefgea rivuli]
MLKKVTVEIRRLARPDGTLRPFMIFEGLPLILPNLWIDDLGMTARENTLNAYLRDLKIMYEWAVENGISIENRIRSLKGFSRPELRKIANLLTTKNNGEICSKSTIYRRIQSIQSFIGYAFDHFIEIDKVPILVQQLVEKNKSFQLNRLEKLMMARANNGPASKPSTDLSSSEIEIIESVLHPASELNPFVEKNVKFRNYCIFLILMETLARRSELVLIEIDDLTLGPNPTVTIKAPSVASKIRRRDGASMKTMGRTVPLSEKVALAMTVYIENCRESFILPRRPSKALFLSQKDGKRLSSNTLNQIFRKIQESPEVKMLGRRIHPHGIRSSAANHARRKIQNNEKANDLEMREALSYLGGWTQNSRMIERYTRSAISERLRSFLLKNGSDYCDS